MTKRGEFKPEHTLTDREYLVDLAERLMHIPVIHGTDQCDVTRLHEIAKRIEQ